MDFLNKPIPERFYSLDVVRGIAALTVLLWHWQHFLYGGTQDTAYRMTDQPLYQYVSLFYNWGWLAVDLFFSLSGFVFFWLYAESISARKIGSWKFFTMRFSRLYPLHILTFAFVLIAQNIFLSRDGTFFVYQYNDLHHAILNIFLASNWGMQKGESFNSPIWSVSIEVLLYMCFFVICLWQKPRPLALALLVLLGLIVAEKYSEIGRGVLSFFAGGLSFSLYSWIKQSSISKHLAPALILMTLLLWVGVIVDFRFGLLSSTAVDLLNSALPTQLQKYIPGIMYRITLRGTTAFLFPATIISLALIETWRGSLGRRASFIGHLSYSSYLLHFPLQLCFIITTSWLGVSREYFYTEQSLMLFVGALIPICFASYYFFEAPTQRYLRSVLNPKITSSTAKASE